MSQFEIIEAGQASVKARHVEESHEYEFGFVRPDGGQWHEPHLISHSEGDGSTGTGLGGLYLKEARSFAAAIHAGESRAWIER